jgi:hypothetical protein
MVFDCWPDGSGYSARIAFDVEGLQWQPVDHIQWDHGRANLTFRRVHGADSQWFSVFITDGVLSGRYTQIVSPSAPKPSISAFTGHLTGWNATQLDRKLVPRAWEVRISGDHLSVARIRIDGSAGEFVGRFKIYARVSGSSSDDYGTWYEEPEIDLSEISWDGSTLRFVRSDADHPDWRQTFVGKADGRHLDGSWSDSTRPGQTFVWGGLAAEHVPSLVAAPGRVEVLGFGLRSRTDDERNEWQEGTRRRLLRLIQGGGPTPTSVTVNPAQLPPNGGPGWMPPLPAPSVPDRDDWPAPAQNYSIIKIEIRSDIPNPYGGTPARRITYARLAVPHTLLPGGLPAVVVLNGHYGSAREILPEAGFSPHESQFYWYGDAFARRNWAVLAVEILHRHDSYVYKCPTGSGALDASSMSVTQNSVTFAPFEDPDWEESGERLWDAMRGLDYLLSLPFVDKERVVVTGLSLGGEISTYLGALDTRSRLVLPAGFSPDMNVENLFGSGDDSHRCFAWAYGVFSEYVDTSDYHALVSPRPLIVETSTGDSTYCPPKLPPRTTHPELPMNQPPCWFRGDKQVARRSRAAYGPAGHNYIHYLHHDSGPGLAGNPDCHRYHVGRQPLAHIGASGATSPGMGPPHVTAAAITEPSQTQVRDWQTDATTSDLDVDLFELIDQLIP